MVLRLPALSSIMAITTLSSWTFHVSLLFTGQLAVSASCVAYWLEPAVSPSCGPSDKPWYSKCPYSLQSSEEKGLPTEALVAGRPGQEEFDNGWVSCYYVANLDRCKDAKYDDKKVKFFTAKDPDTARHEKLGIYCGRGNRVLQNNIWRPKNARPGYNVSGWEANSKGKCKPVPQRIDPVSAAWLQIKGDVKDVKTHKECPYELHWSTDISTSWSQLHPIHPTDQFECFAIKKDDRCKEEWFTTKFEAALDKTGIICVEKAKNQAVPENAYEGVVGYGHVQWYWDEGKMSWLPYLF